MKTLTFTSIEFGSNSKLGKKLAVAFLGIHISGMHHYGSQRFDNGESFHLQRKPENNIKSKGND